MYLCIVKFKRISLNNVIANIYKYIIICNYFDIYFKSSQTLDFIDVYIYFQKSLVLSY